MYKQKAYYRLPNFIQNLVITIFNFLNYKNRYGGNYRRFLNEFKNNNNLSLSELKEIQKNKYAFLIKNSIKKSDFYKNLYKVIDNPEKIENLSKLPIIKKEILKANIKNIQTIRSKDGIISKTGGTTGKSLEVLFTKQNLQERFAALDNFRTSFGYKLGQRTAWFSGKEFISKKDVKNNIFWKTDYYYKVRYYSTFHIKDSYLKFYLKNLIKFKPVFISGFPSSIAELASFGLRKNIDFPDNFVKAIFTTSETLSDEMRFSIETFFKSKIYNQYSASEGAPFIFECSKGNLHLDIQSGVFEVLDSSDQPAVSGRLIVTSFTSMGTPLIRYDIGDSIELSDEKCNCGNNNPIIKRILGREDDFLFSPENGKTNFVNLANAIKEVKGIVKTQFVQNNLNKVIINMVVDVQEYDDFQKSVLLRNLRSRLGNKIALEINLLESIPLAKSGKFRFIINNIKKQI